MREMELLTLTPRQTDLTNDLIILDNRFHITKSKKVRTVPLNSMAKNIVGRRIEAKQADDLFFNFTQHQVTKLFRKYRKKSNTREELTFHSLRHTFASWLVQQGVPLIVVSKLLGHSDLRVTQIYAHVAPDQLKNSVEVINF